MPRQDATVDAWWGVRAFERQDRGIMFELYNEPELPANAADWALWAQGDPTGASTVAPDAVGMQTMVDALRAQGCQNVFVLDGLASAHTLAGVTPISDPLRRIVYAVHPYFDGSADETRWDQEFGVASQYVPVFADEWSAQAGSKLGLGQLPSYQVAVDFLNYIRQHGIPLAGGAFDIPNFMVQDVPGWMPTTYDDYAPSNRKDDAGLLVHTLFVTDYGRPVTAQDGLSSP